MAVLSCEVEPGRLVTAYLSLVGAALEADEFFGAPYWILRGVLYFDPKCLPLEALNKLKGNHGAQSPTKKPTAPVSLEQMDRPEHTSRRDRILLRPAAMDDSQRATSFGTFLQTADCYWPSGFITDRDAPIFADQADRNIFYSGSGNRAQAPQVGAINDCVKLIRRNDQFVSMSRLSEGSVFDRSGVSRGFGYLQGAPLAMTPWLSNEADGVSIDEKALATAPYYEHSCLVFYNGNLHNYYHWLVEGLLSLDILSRALGPSSHLKIALPRSIKINALINHRETLRAVGFDGFDVVDVTANLIKVQEAIWLDSDSVQSMPAWSTRIYKSAL
jgi:hypothetical protein